MILLIDNYDSFVHNLARYFTRLGQPTEVHRNDALAVRDIQRLRPTAIVLSPGPCAPAQAGVSVSVVQQLHTKIPILGVCLGHQAIAEALGGRVRRAPRPVHGQTSAIRHDGRGVFSGLPPEFLVARYHSLIVDEPALPAQLEVSARCADGLVMALRHRRWPLVGVQFHPESILTEHGYPLLANFLQLAGCSVPARLPSMEEECCDGGPPPFVPPSAPVTF